MRYKSNNNIIYSNKYHCIWCTKYRRCLLKGSIKAKLTSIIKEVISEKRAFLLELEIMPDHVHLLVEVDPQYGIHQLIKQIKGRSSRYLRKEFPQLKNILPSALWTNSYFTSSAEGKCCVGGRRR